MTPENETILKDENGIFLKGILGNRIGRVIMTDQRIFFMEQKYYAVGGAIGALAQLAANTAKPSRKLKMNVALDDIAHYEKAKKGMNKNVLHLKTKTDEEFKVSLGSEWDTWEPLLKAHIKH